MFNKKPLLRMRKPSCQLEKRIDKILPLLLDANKNTFEQYKILATLLATANGAAAIALINKDIDLYLNTIFVFAISMFFSLFMLVLSFLSSYSTGNNFKKYINNKSVSISLILTDYFLKSRTMYAIMFISFLLAIVGFECGIIFALNKHNFSWYKLFE